MPTCISTKSGQNIPGCRPNILHTTLSANTIFSREYHTVTKCDAYVGTRQLLCAHKNVCVAFAHSTPKPNQEHTICASMYKASVTFASRSKFKFVFHHHFCLHCMTQPVAFRIPHTFSHHRITGVRNRPARACQYIRAYNIVTCDNKCSARYQQTEPDGFVLYGYAYRIRKIP